MKRFLTLLLAACLLAACGCRAAGTAQGGTAPDAPPPDGAATLSATIVSVEQDGLLLAGSGAYEGVYRVGIKDVPVLLNGQPADAAACTAVRAGSSARCVWNRHFIFPFHFYQSRWGNPRALRL